MKSRVEELIREIKRLEGELTDEVQRMQQIFSYQVRGGRVYFEEAVARYHRTLSQAVRTYIFEASLLNLLTAPMIWACLLPVLFLDAMATLFQTVCFPIYRIPRVKRNEYFIIDRNALAYLNIIERLNCAYCGYVNGLIGYVQEIAGRTEQYWCPIKHARRLSVMHKRYDRFFEYGDAAAYSERFEEVRRDFSDLDNKET